MSEKPAISDEPLPDAELVASAPAVLELSATAVTYSKSDTMPGASEHSDLHDQLPEPHLDTAASGYGHNDPASMAGNIQLDLHDPELVPAGKTELVQPIWGQSAAPAAASDTAADEPHVETASKPVLPPVLAHLAQVGLTSADQWEEQIQPRLAQLHEDIAQVHTQLDVLERQKPKK